MTRDELDRRMVTVVVAEIMHRRHPDLDPAKIMDLTFVSLEVLDRSLDMLRQVRHSGAIGPLPIIYSAKMP